MVNSIVAFSAPAATQVASATNVTSASLTWLTGDVIVVFGTTEGGTNGETMAAPTTTGSGISFGAAQKLHQSTGADSGLGCWAAVATAGSTGTFSINSTHDSGTRYQGIAVYIIRGSSGIGNSVLYTGVSPTGVSLTPTGGADGTIVWAAVDWAAAAVTGMSPTSTAHNASTPGPTASPMMTQASPSYTYYFGVLDDQTSAGAVSYGITGSGTGPFVIIAFEAKAAAGGPQTYNVPVDDNRGLVDSLTVDYTPGPGVMVWTTNVGIG